MPGQVLINRRQSSDIMCLHCDVSECIGIPGSHRGDWFCAKCEKIMKKPHANNLKVKRSTPGGAEREDPRARYTFHNNYDFCDRIPLLCTEILLSKLVDQ